MAIFKCKMCGGALEVNNESVAVCEYCGTQQTLPKLNDDRKANLYDRANHFRRNNEFDKAMSIYENILNEDKTDAESYWSIVLCRYGIEYVEDPVSRKRVPTVNRAQFTSVFDDDNYKSALQYADEYQRVIYENEAKAINEIQKGILAISQKEEPFDVFVCYKETDNNGRRTPDSVLATELYHELTKEGFKVFFSRITLEDKLGTAYEPYIFAALNSAKVMVVLGTKQEYFNAVWVKNEWSRYLALIKQGQKKMLIPAYKDMDPYDLPEEFSHLQAQDMSKLGFVQDLVRGITKITAANKPEPTTVKETIINNEVNSNVTALLKRGFLALEDSEWAKADNFFEQCLNQNAEFAEAYLGKLMAECRAKTKSDLINCVGPFNVSNNYQKIMRFGDKELISELEGYIKAITERNECNRIEGIYNHSLNLMSSATTESEFNQAAAGFKSINEYKNSAKLAEKCLYRAETSRCNNIYSNAVNLMNKKTASGYEKAASLFEQIIDWQDSEELLEICKQRLPVIREIENKKKKRIKLVTITSAAVAVIIAVVIFINSVIIPAANYSKALRLAEKGYYDQAISILTELGDYKDAADKILETNYNKAANLAEKGDYATAANCYGKAGDYKDAKEKCFETWGRVTVRETISASKFYHTVALKSDGTVVATGYTKYGACDVSDWTDIVAVATGNYHTVGLKSDGTVVATKYIEDEDSSYSFYDGQCDVSDWTDIVAIAAGGSHTVGLKSDGTVVTTDDWPDLSDWTDIVAIFAGSYNTFGLKSDGTVVTTSSSYDVSGWTNIVAVSIGDNHTVGLKSDGTVVAVGDNDDGECDVSDWTDIVAVSASWAHTVGLKSDGTVVAVGDNDDGQCDVSDWEDIVAISSGDDYTVGLKSDGTVVAVGDSFWGKCNVSGWKDIKQP